MQINAEPTQIDSEINQNPRWDIFMLGTLKSTLKSNQNNSKQRWRISNQRQGILRVLKSTLNQPKSNQPNLNQRYISPNQRWNSTEQRWHISAVPKQVAEKTTHLT